MNKHYEVIIAGGGVIGCSIAYELTLRGKSVLLLDRGAIGGEASGAAAGMLGAQAEFLDSEQLFQLALRSRALFPQLADSLREVGGVDIGWRNDGLLRIARTDEEVRQYKSVMNSQLQSSSVEEVEWLEADEVLSMEPNITAEVRGALYLKRDTQVSAPELTLAFARAAAALGADLAEYVEVTSMLEEHGRVIGVRTGEGDYFADHVVAASGLWTQMLLRPLGLSLPLYSVKGECVAVRTRKPLVKRTLYTDGCYIVPKGNGETVIGATKIPHRVDRTVEIQGVLDLLGRAEKLVSSIRDSSWSRAWSGLRPQTPDGLPYIGRHPELTGLLVAAGHYRNGILLSPITGVIIADLIDGKEPDIDISAFAIQRELQASTV